MKRCLFLLTAALFIGAGLAHSGTRSCTAGMVTLNICRSTSDVAYCLPISTVDPDAGGPLLAPSALIADAFATVYNHQTPTACTEQHVSAGICTSGQIGTLVAITKAQFADMQVRDFVMRTIRRYRVQQATATAQASAEAEAAPDVGN